MHIRHTHIQFAHVAHTCTHSTHDATHVFCGLRFQPFGSPGASWCLRGVVRGPREPPVPGERGRPALRLFAGLPPPHGSDSWEAGDVLAR